MNFIMPQYRKTEAPPSDHEVDIRIAGMDWLQLRGLSQDYRDICRRSGTAPRAFRGWLRDRVADQLIAKAYDEQRSWY